MFDIKNQYSVVLIVSLSVIFAVEIYKKPKITHFAVFSFSCSCVNPHLHTRVACLNCHVLYFCTMCSFYRKTAGCFFCLAFFCLICGQFSDVRIVFVYFVSVYFIVHVASLVVSSVQWLPGKTCLLLCVKLDVKCCSLISLQQFCHCTRLHWG